jgi:hypothetical protein
MSTIAGTLSFIDETKNRNVQGFQDVSFLIKTEKLSDEDTQARLYFMDNDPVEECEIPIDIECKETNENNNIKTKNPFFRNNFFLISHPKKYEIFYKKTKIYSLIPEQKRYTVHNFNKPDNVKQYETEKRIIKAFNTIIKLEEN